MRTRTAWTAIGVLAIIVVLYIIQVRNYLLFHALTELFSIVIAFGIFVVAWNGRRYTHGEYLLTLGIAYLFIGFLDLLHTLGYTGMNVFPDYDYYANQLWVAARYMESITLLVVVARIGTPREARVGVLFGVYTAITGAVIYSIFFSDIFPPGFVEGVGQTRFKVVSEYVINAILIATLLLAIRGRRHFPRGTFGLFAASIATTIVAEVAFTFYVSNYGISNMIGHYAKAVSFYLIYRAVIQKTIAEPYQTIFSQLTERTEELDTLNRIHRDVFSIIAHDLRGPFGTIRSFVALLGEGWEARPAEERRELAGELSQTVDRTYLLAENLLRWAESETSEASIERSAVPLASLVDEVSGTLALQAARKEITVRSSVAGGAAVQADPDTLRIVLHNVLSNALKFSERGRTIEIESCRRDGQDEIAVIDHGRGIDVAAANDVRRRYRSTRGTAGEKGTGLGLAVVHRFTTRNGGTATFEPTPGGGTTVRLAFPAAVSDGLPAPG